MLTFGITVEGNYDAAVLTELIRKSLANNVEVISRICGSQSTLMRKFPSYLESFRHAKHGSHVDKALIIRDADNKNPHELVRVMQGRYTPGDYPFPVHIVLAVQELETWLLADRDALTQVTLAYSGREASSISGSLESISNPKERLKSLLADAKVPYTQEVARKIAAAANLDTIAYRCSSFRSFLKAVRDL